MKIQSVQASLSQVDEAKIPDFDKIHKCLTVAHKSLRSVLTGGSSKGPRA